MTRQSSKQQQTLVLSAMALAISMMAGQVRADTPLSLSVSETLTYDSNIIRDNGNKHSDRRSTTSATLGFDKDYGRQHYSAAITGDINRYKNTTELDNDGYNIRLGFSSSIASNWDVSLDHYSVKELQSFEEQSGSRYPENIISRVTQAFIQYGVYGRWSANLTLGHSQSDYETINAYDKKSNYGKVGLRYSPTDLVYFDAGIRRTKSDMPNYPMYDGRVLGDPIERTDYELESRWIVTGYSSLLARLGWTQERHDNDSLRDFNGLTGSLNWSYSPTGKTTYSMTVDRDTNNAGGNTLKTGYINTVQLGEQPLNSVYTNQNRLTTGLSLSANHRATAKISVNAGLVYKRFKEEQRQLQDLLLYPDQQFSGVSRKNGAYRSFSLGASYQVLRQVKLGCSFEKYDRSASLFNREYDGEQVSCNVALTLD